MVLARDAAPARDAVPADGVGLDGGGVVPDDRSMDAEEPAVSTEVAVRPRAGERAAAVRSRAVGSLARGVSRMRGNLPDLARVRAGLPELARNPVTVAAAAATATVATELALRAVAELV